MKLYAIRRPMGWKTPEDLAEAAATSARVGDTEMSSDIRWIRSYVVIEADGTLGTICIYEASSPDKIREHAERAGLPATEIWEVADTVIVREDPVAAAAWELLLGAGLRAGPAPTDDQLPCSSQSQPAPSACATSRACEARCSASPS
jgi:hypothetical protein